MTNSERPALDLGQDIFETFFLRSVFLSLGMLFDLPLKLELDTQSRWKIVSALASARYFWVEDLDTKRIRIKPSEDYSSRDECK